MAQFGPEIRYTPPGGGGEIVITLSIPHDVPNLRTETLGGSRRSRSGVVAAYRKRLEDLAELDLRVTEAERLLVRAWLLNSQYGRPFSFKFDATDAATLYNPCYLVSPAMGERIDWPRDPDYHYAYRTPIVIRAAAGVVFDVRQDPS